MRKSCQLLNGYIMYLDSPESKAYMGHRHGFIKSFFTQLKNSIIAYNRKPELYEPYLGKKGMIERFKYYNIMSIGQFDEPGQGTVEAYDKLNEAGGRVRDGLILMNLAQQGKVDD